MSPRVACGAGIVNVTPPKVSPDGLLPKAVASVRSTLLERGVSLEGLSAKKVYETLDPKEVNKLATSFRNTMSAAARQAYKEVSPADRREWLAQYIVDPQLGTSVGFTQTEATNSRLSTAKEAWITEAEMGGPLWLNDTQAAKILCESGELPSRPHERPCLAAKGMLQFEFSKEMVSSTGATS